MIENKPLDLAAELGAEIGKEAGPKILDAGRSAMFSQSCKPGNTTSEYRMAGLLVFAGLLLIALGKWSEDPNLVKQGGDIVAIIGAGYAVSRGIAKASIGVGANK